MLGRPLALGSPVIERVEHRFAVDRLLLDAVDDLRLWSLTRLENGRDDINDVARKRCQEPLLLILGRPRGLTVISRFRVLTILSHQESVP